MTDEASGGQGAVNVINGLGVWEITRLHHYYYYFTIRTGRACINTYRADNHHPMFQGVWRDWRDWRDWRPWWSQNHRSIITQVQQTKVPLDYLGIPIWYYSFHFRPTVLVLPTVCPTGSLGLGNVP